MCNYAKDANGNDTKVADCGDCNCAYSSNGGNHTYQQTGEMFGLPVRQCTRCNTYE